MTLVQRLRSLKTCVFCFRITSLLALLLCFLLAYNGLSIFYLNLPFIARFPPQPSNSNSSSSSHAHSSSKKLASSSSVMYVIREDNSGQFLKPNLAPLNRNQSPKPNPVPKTEPPAAETKKRARKKKRLSKEDLLSLSSDKLFASRIEEFFGNCAEPRFFMTWISSLDSFGDRESFAVESLFWAHPGACLAVVSKTMDSARGREILRPFAKAGFRVAAVSPDYDFLFAKTPAEDWLRRLRGGHVDPGKIPLGQNISNLLRLCLLYKYGGVYADTDVVFVKSFSGLRNTVGAQSTDAETGRWRLLNNAVLVFDKAHPLVLEFIGEFARTFNGYRWGYNGPYMVSRVVERVGPGPGPGSGLTVLPPSAFYPVLWMDIGELFRASEEKWRVAKTRQILEESYAVHLWNKESKMLRVESGSVIDRMRRHVCVFCNKTMLVSRPTSSKFVN